MHFGPALFSWAPTGTTPFAFGSRRNGLPDIFLEILFEHKIFKATLGHGQNFGTATDLSEKVKMVAPGHA